jgi:hypothetical protein
MTRARDNGLRSRTPPGRCSPSRDAGRCRENRNLARGRGDRLDLADARGKPSAEGIQGGVGSSDRYRGDLRSAAARLPERRVRDEAPTARASKSSGSLTAILLEGCHRFGFWSPLKSRSQGSARPSTRLARRHGHGLPFWSVSPSLRRYQGIGLCQHGGDHSRSFAYWEPRLQLLHNVRTRFSEPAIRVRCIR